MYSIKGFVDRYIIDGLETDMACKHAYHGKSVSPSLSTSEIRNEVFKYQKEKDESTTSVSIV